MGLGRPTQWVTGCISLTVETIHTRPDCCLLAWQVEYTWNMSHKHNSHWWQLLSSLTKLNLKHQVTDTVFENSVTRVTFQHHSASLVMLRDGIFNSHWTTIIDSFFFWQLHLNLHLNFNLNYFINTTLKYIYILVKKCLVWLLLTTLTSKRLPNMDVKNSCHDVKKTPWHNVRWHFLAPVSCVEISVWYARIYEARHNLSLKFSTR